MLFFGWILQFKKNIGPVEDSMDGAIIHTPAVFIYTPTFRTISADENQNFLSFLRSFPNTVMMKKADYKPQKI
jgi:hypothetical protein